MHFAMKKFFNLAAISLAISAVALTACNKESELEIAPEQQEVELIFSSEKPDFIDESNTRTVFHADEKAIYWSSSDKIRVAIKVGDNWQTNTGNADPTNEVYAKLYESNQAGSESKIVDFKVPTSFAPTTTGTYEFYAFYPHSLVSSANANQYMPSVAITIPDEQTPPIGSFDPNADVMTAVSVGEYTGIPEDRVVLLDWTRQVAHGDITLKKLPVFESDEILRSISIIAQEGADLAGYHYLDMTTGSITLPTNNTPVNTITVLAKDGNLDVNSDGNINFWFSSLPFTATSLKIVITTNKYTYTKEYKNISKEFKRNNRNILGISMSNAAKEESVEEQLIANGTYAIHGTFTDNVDYMMVASTGSKQASSVYSTTVGSEGLPVVAGDAAWIVTYDRTNNVYYIQNAETETYLSGTAGNTDLKLVAAGNKVGFSAEAVTGGLHLSVSNSTSTRWIGLNTSNSNVIFGMYNNDNNYPGLLQFTAVKANLVPSLTFSIKEKEVAASVETVEFPFVAKHLTGAINTSIKTGSDDIIVENGVAVGNDKITVTLTPNEDNSPKTATIVVSTDGVDDQELIINQKGKPESGSIAPLNTVLFSEDFAGFANGDVPTSSNSQTVVFGNGTLEYTCTGSGTKIYTGTMSAGGTSPEILVNGSFKITGIPTGGAKKIALSYGSNKGTGTLKLEVAGGSIGTISNSGKTYSGTITPSSETIDLTFSASSNSRLDDIILTVSEAGSGGETTTVATPTFTLPEGTYSTSQTVEIECATEGATIYYTIDGTDPNGNSNEFTAALTISVTTTVKAIAIKDGVSSEIAEATYTINNGSNPGTIPDPETITITGVDNQGSSNASVVFGGGGTPSAWYASDGGVRCYVNNTITVSSTYSIAKLEIEYLANKNNKNVYPTGVTANTGSFTTAYSTAGGTMVWEGESNSIVMTVQGSAGNVAVKSIRVTYAE